MLSVFCFVYDFVPSQNHHAPHVHAGKKEVVQWQTEDYACFAVGTPVVDGNTDLSAMMRDYVLPWLKPADVVFCSEKMIACAQGRARLLTDIHPTGIARLLSRFVTRSPYGIGLSMPETMQCAIDECGLFRILLAAFCGMVGKLIGKKGWFYKIAGNTAAAVDGPCSYTLPPYNRYVVPGPEQVEKVAGDLSVLLGGRQVLIVDANDLGCTILADSHHTCPEKWETLLRQNPLGQSTEQTPVGILRPLSAQ